MRSPEPRVGYVLKMYPRFSETFVLNELLALEELGADLRVFSLRHPVDGRFHEALAALRAPVTYLPHRLRSSEAWALVRDRTARLPRAQEHWRDLLDLDVDDAVAAVTLACAVLDEGITHLHAHFGSVSTSVARVASLLSGVGYTFTAHAKDIFHDDVDRADLRRKLSDADAVVTVSDYNHEHLRQTYGAAADQVVRIYNGLDLEVFDFTGAPGPRPTVVGVGRLVEKKGFTHLVDAMALLRAQGREVDCVLIGSGPEAAALREQVSRLDLDDRFVFHGALPQGQVREQVRAAHVLAAPCVVGADGNRDGLPTVLLEALAAGTPCVATPVTGIPEAVRPGETGLLVPEGDAAALAAAIATLLDDPDHARALALAGRALVEEHFDVRRSAAALLALFTSLTSSRHETRGVPA